MEQGSCASAEQLFLTMSAGSFPVSHGTLGKDWFLATSSGKLPENSALYQKNHHPLVFVLSLADQGEWEWRQLPMEASKLLQ